MLSGKLFRLSRDTVSLEATGARRQVVRVPEDAVIEVVRLRPGLEGRKMAEVRWLGKTLEMFVEDIERRGEAILAQTATK